MSDQTPMWKVVSTVPVQGRDPSGAFVPGWNVTYQLESGAQGQVFVPKTSADMNAVKQVIAADAALLAGLTGLTSG